MKVVRKFLLVAIATSLLALLATWGILLGTICSSPSTASLATQHIITYNCHGSTVFVTPLQQALLDWIVPVGFLLTLAEYLVKRWQPST
jgi:hypothetical protein